LHCISFRKTPAYSQLIRQDKENETNRKIINIVKVFRSPDVSTQSDIRINNLEKIDGNFYMIDEYQSNNLFNRIIFEKGVSEIVLNKNSGPMNGKIDPKNPANKI
jgi:hypothetical protein